MLARGGPHPPAAGPHRPEHGSPAEVRPEAAWSVFKGLDSAAGLLLAVSGGPDSTALMHLAAGWARHVGRPLPHVACVDHGLRPGSRHEADGVLAAARALGLPAVRLEWTGPKPATGRAERARAARYALLVRHARDIGASHLLTGHTLDDQAETVLMRLARGTGWMGVAAMHPSSHCDGITLARPLLGMRKAALVSLCAANRWPYVEDPGNRDRSSTRVRWRQLAEVLEREGLTAERLARFAARAARAEAALQQMADTARCDLVRPGLAGGARIDMSGLAAHPADVRLRVVAASLTDVGGRERIPLERLEALMDALAAGFAGRRELRRTLGGCVVELRVDGILAVTTEPPRRRGLGPNGALEARVDQLKTEPRSEQLGPRTKRPHFTLTARSLGNGSPVSYIAHCDTTARSADAVETRCTSLGEVRDVWHSTGRQ